MPHKDLCHNFIKQVRLKEDCWRESGTKELQHFFRRWVTLLDALSCQRDVTTSLVWAQGLQEQFNSSEQDALDLKHISRVLWPSPVSNQAIEATVCDERPTYIGFRLFSLGGPSGLSNRQNLELQSLLPAVGLKQASHASESTPSDPALDAKLFAWEHDKQSRACFRIFQIEASTETCNISA